MRNLKLWSLTWVGLLGLTAAAIWLTQPAGARLLRSKSELIGETLREREPILDPVEPTGQELNILALVLRKNFAGEILPTQAYENISYETREGLRTRFAKSSPKVDSLLNRFARLNQKPLQLSIQPSAEDGYVIDYKGTIPHCGPVVGVPAYDSETGMVVAYVRDGAPHFCGCGDWEGIAGWFVLYHYQEGLEEVQRVPLRHHASGIEYTLN